MGQNSKISWTDHTFNPVWGCTKVGPGCDHCYAESFDRRVGGDHWGAGKLRREFGDKHWNEPLKWNAAAEKAGVRAKVFCASFADVFDKEWPAYARPRLWKMIKATPWLDWIIVTKRIGNAVDMFPEDWGDGYDNVWLLITVVTQEEADRDVPKLMHTPAKVRGLSVEPQLGHIHLGYIGWPNGKGERRTGYNALIGARYENGEMVERLPKLDWVITGAESGYGRRDYDEEWARSLRDQCEIVGIAFFYKQKIDERGRKVERPKLDGRQHADFPKATSAKVAA